MVYSIDKQVILEAASLIEEFGHAGNAKLDKSNPDNAKARSDAAVEARKVIRQRDQFRQMGAHEAANKADNDVRGRGQQGDYTGSSNLMKTKEAKLLSTFPLHKNAESHMKNEYDSNFEKNVKNAPSSIYDRQKVNSNVVARPRLVSSTPKKSK
jgi:hypothetical protein